MSALLIAFLFGIGVGGWVYSKMSHRTGGNYKSSLTVAAIVGLAGLLVIYILLKTTVSH
jgi:hypothetical protein